MHTVYYNVGTEMLNICYNTLYIQNFKQLILIYGEETKDKTKN